MSKVVKVYFCPCDCKTPKGMAKKFYKVQTLIEHISSVHDKAVELKYMYRMKTSELQDFTSKKRTFEEYEDGFKEIKSVVEENADREIEINIDDLGKSFSKKSSVDDD